MEKLTLTSSHDGLSLSVLLLPAVGEARANIQLVHGMCEHKERYIPFMEFLSENGYNCIIHDHRGHGESIKNPKDLGFMYSGKWQGLVDDILTVNEYLRSRFPGLPMKLLGHSMGSMAVRSFVKRHDELIDGLFVVGSPADNKAKGLGKALADAFCAIAPHSRPRILQRLTLDDFNMHFRHEGLPCAWVCSDPEVLKAYHSDPLCMFRFTANGFSSLLGLMNDCYSTEGWKVSNPDLPVHFLSGAEDGCGGMHPKSMEHSVDMMRQAGYRNVDLKLYPGMRHEILNETDKAQVWNDILKLL